MALSPVLRLGALTLVCATLVSSQSNCEHSLTELDCRSVQVGDTHEQVQDLLGACGDAALATCSVPLPNCGAPRCNEQCDITFTKGVVDSVAITGDKGSD